MTQKISLGVGLSLILAILALWFSLNYLFTKNMNTTGGIACLPTPIGREPVLVTTLGQGIDGLLISEYLRDLHVFTVFRQKAEDDDLRDMRTLILVIGNEFNLDAEPKRQFSEERIRAKLLLKKAKEIKIPVVLVLLRNYPNLNNYDVSLFKEILKDSNYVLMVGNQRLDNLLLGYKGYYTRVLRLQDLKVPLNSILR